MKFFRFLGPKSLSLKGTGRREMFTYPSVVYRRRPTMSRRAGGSGEVPRAPPGDTMPPVYSALLKNAWCGLFRHNDIRTVCNPITQRTRRSAGSGERRLINAPLCLTADERAVTPSPSPSSCVLSSSAEPLRPLPFRACDHTLLHQIQYDKYIH